MKEQNFNPALFDGMDEPKKTNSSPKQKKQRSPGYRTGDLVLNKQDILDNVEFLTIPGIFVPIPVIQRVESFDVPKLALPSAKSSIRIAKM